MAPFFSLDGVLVLFYCPKMLDGQPLNIQSTAHRRSCAADPSVRQVAPFASIASDHIS